jgi:hypothetical protein
MNSNTNPFEKGVPRRQFLVSTSLAAPADKRWIYSVTSGAYSPPKHAGADALAILASSLTLEELEKAEKAIPPQTAVDKERGVRFDVRRGEGGAGCAEVGGRTQGATGGARGGGRGVLRR